MDDPRGDEGVMSRSAGVVGLVDDYLQTQYARLTQGEQRLRTGENAVHDTRVAVRRTRSTLKVFGSMFDPERTAHLDAELRWYAEVLGAVRDVDVMRRRLDKELRRTSDDLVSREAVDRLLDLLGDQHDRAWHALLTALDGERYGALVGELGAWQREPPLTPEALVTSLSDSDGADQVDRFLHRARRKSSRRLAQARAADDAVVDEALHRARKAAKRTRYVAELARPALGDAARQVANEHEDLQDLLGAVQDDVVLAATLREFAARAGTPADVAFLCGVLSAQHADAAARTRDALRLRAARSGGAPGGLQGLDTVGSSG